MNHQTLHVSHIGQQREDLQGIDELPGLFLSTLDLEGEDGAATIGEVLLVQLMVWMALQSGVVDTSHLGVILQELNHLERVLYMTLNTQAQRLDTL